MIIIKCSGGLGNQMFEYALALKYVSLGCKVRLDISEYEKDNPYREWGLDIFGITSTENIRIDGNNFINRVIGWIFKKLLIYNDKIAVFQPQIFSFRNRMLCGYWQNEKYFVDIQDSVKKAFCFDENLLNDKNILLAREMSECNSVSIHVRRGDYLDVANQGVYDQICNEEYYRRAIDLVNTKVENAKFFLFSDDIEWTKMNVWREGMRIVDWNTDTRSWEDMYLMKQCKHHIIANSTFSWWGAWLGNYNEKIVVAPSRWFFNNDCIETICDDWIRV